MKIQLNFKTHLFAEEEISFREAWLVHAPAVHASRSSHGQEQQGTYAEREGEHWQLVLM